MESTESEEAKITGPETVNAEGSFASRLLAGEYGLAITYWVTGLPLQNCQDLAVSRSVPEWLNALCYDV